MVYSRFRGPWVVKKPFILVIYAVFWLHTTFHSQKGGIFLKRRWYVAKVVYSLIGIYDIPEPCWLGLAGGQGLEAPALPASLSLGLDWIVTSRMQ